MHVVKLACERPDDAGRSLSQWDCAEIARQLVRDGVVPSISAETVRQILLHHRLKPWRQKMWLSAKVPRDAAFAAQVQGICDLYTRPLRPDEVVLCVDEMTSLQPRPRKSKTLAAKKDRPTRVEHEYGRCGALNLFAAFDTRTGKVYGSTASRKRQVEFIAFLEQLDREIPATVKTIHVVLDNLPMHKGKQVQEWLVDARDRGASILLISEDLDEVMQLSDRIAVIYEGEIVGSMPAAGANREQIGLMMAGAHPRPAEVA